METVDRLVVLRSTEAEAYAYIEKDLREAAVMLPSVYNAQETGKAAATTRRSGARST